MAPEVTPPRAVDNLERIATVGLLALALVLPFLTLVTHPDLGRMQAITIVPALLFTVGVQLALGILIARSDRWLGVFVVYMAVRAWFTPLATRPFATSEMITFGALVLMLLRRLPTRWHPRIQVALVVVGLVQVVIALGQWAGVDPFFPDGPYVKDRQLPGTIGHGNWLGVYLAGVALLAPAWALPVFLLGLMLAQSRLGLIALAVAGLVRWWPSMRLALKGNGEEWKQRYIGLGVLFIAVVTMVSGLDKTLTTWSARWEIWRLGITIWAQHGPLFGLGPGSWSLYVPSAQEAFKVGVCPGACFAQAHNEVLQLLFEGGAVAIVLLGLWLYEHRQAVSTPQGGALVALGVCSLGMFPWHLAQVAVPALVVIAMATAKEDG